MTAMQLSLACRSYVNSTLMYRVCVHVRAQKLDLGAVRSPRYALGDYAGAVLTCQVSMASHSDCIGGSNHHTLITDNDCNTETGLLLRGRPASAPGSLVTPTPPLWLWP